jgi:aspartate aminotransferase-like enzyme
LNFSERIYAPGPTPVPESARLTLAETNTYHRTDVFSEVIEDVSGGLADLLDVDWPVLPLAASGTGAMQAAVNNTVSPDETAFVIESGKFGERWSRMLRERGAQVVTHEVPWGESLDPAAVREVLGDHPDVDVVFSTLVETSTLVRHPIEELGSLLDEDHLLVVDAISGFVAESFYPEQASADLVVLGGQKGLMAPPGIAAVAASPRVLERSQSLENRGTYFDLPRAADTLRQRSQTPWTPPMNLLRSLQESVRQLRNEGIQNVIERHEILAKSCRRAIRTLGLDVFTEDPSNAGTPVEVPEDLDAEALRELLHERYGVFFPGGQGPLTGRLLRVGHLGDVDFFDLLSGISALELGLKRQSHLNQYELGTGLQAAQRTYEEHDNDDRS